MALDNDTLQARVNAMEEHGSLRKAAEALGIAASTLHDSLKIASARGLNGFKPVLDGFRLTKTTTKYDADGKVSGEYVTQKLGEVGERFELPVGQEIDRLSTLIDADGNVVQQWIKSKTGVSTVDIVESLKNAFRDVPAAPVIPAPTVAHSDMLTLLPLADLHVGMYSWGKETGVDWDLSIAEEVLGRAIEEVVDRSPSSGTAIVLGGGDLLHSDNKNNQTARSGNQLDVDGRYQKVLMAANRLMVRAVDANLRKHSKVIVRILPGNHDEHASVAVAYFLLAWYRDNPRVTVDVDPSLFFWFEFGKVALGATHGHEAKLKDMAGIMAHRKAEMWGRTKFRYVHGFHIHHKSVLASEGMGCTMESHQTPTPQDAWHFGAGFLSGRSIQSITYHMLYGEMSRARVALLDG